MGWFKKLFKDDSSTITTRITRTSSQALHEQKVKKEAHQKASICPNCGSECDPGFPLSYESYYNRFCYVNECKKCGTKWETDYKI